MRTKTLTLLLAVQLAACGSTTDLGGAVAPSSGEAPAAEVSAPKPTEPSAPPEAVATSPGGERRCEPAWTTFGQLTAEEGSAKVWWSAKENWQSMGAFANDTVVLAAIPNEIWESPSVFAWTLRIRQDAEYRDVAKAAGQQWEHTAFVVLVDALARVDLATMPERVRRRILEPSASEQSSALRDDGSAKIWDATLQHWPAMGDGQNYETVLNAVPAEVWSDESVYVWALFVRQDAAYRSEVIEGARKWNHTSHEWLVNALSSVADQLLPEPLLTRLEATPAWQRCY